MYKIFLLFLLSIVNSYSFEVNTHQAITRCAITNKCKTTDGKAYNLENFINDTLLADKMYTEEVYEGYYDEDKNVPSTYFSELDNGK